MILISKKKYESIQKEIYKIFGEQISKLKKEPKPINKIFYFIMNETTSNTTEITFSLKSCDINNIKGLNNLLNNYEENNSFFNSSPSIKIPLMRKKL